MRTGIVAVVLTVIALTIFNPGMDEFRVFVADRAEEMILDETGDSALGQLLSGAGGSLAGRYVDTIAERDNYILFSTYTIDFDDEASGTERWSFLGIAGQFLELERPEQAR